MQKLLSKTFLWMFIGLLVTFVTGYLISTSEVMVQNLFGSSKYIIFIIAEFILVFVLSARVMKMSATMARVCFILYSFLTGLTFSSIFLAYNLNSIIYVFAIAAAVFGVMALIGAITKIDLTKIGTYFIFGILAIIIMSIINAIFIKSSGLEMTISAICLLLFVGVTAHDVQKIKNRAEADMPVENLAICGALDLYLDFINIFIELLRIFGNSKD